MSGWVACSDRLPEVVDGGVIVYFSEMDSIETVNIKDHFAQITAGLNDDGEQLYSYWYLSCGITHWMPLPDAPEVPA